MVDVRAMRSVTSNEVTISCTAGLSTSGAEFVLPCIITLVWGYGGIGCGLVDVWLIGGGASTTVWRYGLNDELDEVAQFECLKIIYGSVYFSCGVDHEYYAVDRTAHSRCVAHYLSWDDGTKFWIIVGKAGGPGLY